jgi:hypothetical protein
MLVSSETEADGAAGAFQKRDIVAGLDAAIVQLAEVQALRM